MNHVPHPTNRCRRPLLSRGQRVRRALAAEARMVALWLWSPVATGLEAMLRFAFLPRTSFAIRPGQFPAIEALAEQYDALEDSRQTLAREEPFPTLGAPRPPRPVPSKRRIVKIFHAARHAEE